MASQWISDHKSCNSGTPQLGCVSEPMIAWRHVVLSLISYKPSTLLCGVAGAQDAIARNNRLNIIPTWTWHFRLFRWAYAIRHKFACKFDFICSHNLNRTLTKHVAKTPQIMANQTVDLVRIRIIIMPRSSRSFTAVELCESVLWKAGAWLCCQDHQEQHQSEMERALQAPGLTESLCDYFVSEPCQTITPLTGTKTTASKCSDLRGTGYRPQVVCMQLHLYYW